MILGCYAFPLFFVLTVDTVFLFVFPWLVPYIWYCLFQGMQRSFRPEGQTLRFVCAKSFLIALIPTCMWSIMFGFDLLISLFVFNELPYL